MKGKLRLILVALVLSMVSQLPMGLLLSVAKKAQADDSIRQDPLVLRHVLSEMVFESGTKKLKIAGEVHNNTQGSLPIPNIIVVVKGPENEALRNWRIPVSPATVSPDGTVAFSSTVNAPQEMVTQINLHFAEADNAR